jgi:hypothetical protein
MFLRQATELQTRVVGLEVIHTTELRTLNAKKTQYSNNMDMSLQSKIKHSIKIWQKQREKTPGRNL